ncbi:hypothetical protein Hanom_Chr12g01135141 [Helianthus anomalus]
MDSDGPWLDPHHLKKKDKGHLPHATGRDNVMKFFVSNLPDKCCSKDIGEFFGVVSGWVSDGSEMEGRMKGLKMGTFKLRINVARFAAENNSFQHSRMVSKVQNVSRNQSSGPSGLDKGNLRFGSRDVRSYSNVVGNPFGAGDSSSGPSSGSKNNDVKNIVVPDRTAAFSELYDVAVVGRAVDLETLVDLDKLLRIAKSSFSNIHYLGGFIYPHFIHRQRIGSVAWLNLYGIPLHLLESEVLVNIGELFGKVMHSPKGLVEDRNLSIFRVGVLVRESERIVESVVLKWKDKSFRVRVEEDQEVWNPDCLDHDSIVDFGDPECSSPLRSPPIAHLQVSDNDGFGEANWMDGKKGKEKSDGWARDDFGERDGLLGIGDPISNPVVNVGDSIPSFNYVPSHANVYSMHEGNDPIHFVYVEEGSDLGNHSGGGGNTDAGMGPCDANSLDSSGVGMAGFNKYGRAQEKVFFIFLQGTNPKEPGKNRSFLNPLKKVGANVALMCLLVP